MGLEIENEVEKILDEAFARIKKGGYDASYIIMSCLFVFLFLIFLIFLIFCVFWHSIPYRYGTPALIVALIFFYHEGISDGAIRYKVYFEIQREKRWIEERIEKIRNQIDSAEAAPLLPNHYSDELIRKLDELELHRMALRHKRLGVKS